MHHPFGLSNASQAFAMTLEALTTLREERVQLRVVVYADKYIAIQTWISISAHVYPLLN